MNTPKINIRSAILPKTTYKYTKRAHLNQPQRSRHLTNYKYTSHKNIKRHYKQQMPYRIIDVRSIRYGAAHIIQRCIDLFIIIWFVFGNYWVLGVFEQYNEPGKFLTMSSQPYRLPNLFDGKIMIRNESKIHYNNNVIG